MSNTHLHYDMFFYKVNHLIINMGNFPIYMQYTKKWRIYNLYDDNGMDNIDHIYALEELDGHQIKTYCVEGPSK